MVFKEEKWSHKIKKLHFSFFVFNAFSRQNCLFLVSAYSVNICLNKITLLLFETNQKTDVYTTHMYTYMHACTQNTSLSKFTWQDVKVSSEADKKQ